MSGPRRVLVTGASRGVGRATVHRLRRDGYDPVGLARTVPAGLAAGQEFVECDLGDTGAVRETAAALAKTGPFYALVNNAAMSPITSMDDTSLDDMDIANRVNVLAPLLLTQALAPGSPPGHPRTIALKAAVPLQRVGSPQEVAHVIAFLLDDLAGFITGQTIHIDGGLTISAVK
jgi:3-oxoacyl-[acyl-carrier protein] reductase